MLQEEKKAEPKKKEETGQEAVTRPKVDTLGSESESEDSEEDSEDRAFVDDSSGSDDEDLHWKVDPNSTRARTEEEMKNGPPAGTTWGMKRYQDTLKSIEERAIKLENAKLKRKQMKMKSKTDSEGK